MKPLHIVYGITPQSHDQKVPSPQTLCNVFFGCLKVAGMVLFGCSKGVLKTFFGHIGVTKNHP